VPFGGRNRTPLFPGWVIGRFTKYGSLSLGEGGSAANEIDLKQGSGVVVGELWLLKCGRGRQNRLSFTGSDSRVDGSLFGACERKFIRRGCFVDSTRANGSVFGAIVFFSDQGLIHELLYWIPRRI